jgi:DNA-directed RNA polymerase specialized sigma24 family protein
VTRPPRRERALVRPHVVTGGRGTPTHRTFDHVTLVSAVRDDLDGLTPEQQRLIRLCLGGWLSIAEVAAHLVLPVSVTKVLLADLVDTGHITATAPRGGAAPITRELLQEVHRALLSL